MNQHEHDANDASCSDDDEEEEEETTLPLDLVANILSRLPVKLLLQLRCVRKSWKSLISDPKFAQKHLSMTKAFEHHHHLIIGTESEIFLWDIHFPSIFTTLSPSHSPLNRPDFFDTNDYHVCSCDGILCFTIHRTIHDTFHSFPILWNRSLRRFNAIPSVEYAFPNRSNHTVLERRAVMRNKNRYRQRSIYSFGYDNRTHTYKIVAISCFFRKRVNIYTMGTQDSSWRRIPDFPRYQYTKEPGKFVTGTINWLVSGTIVALDLDTETYQQLSLPPPTTGENFVTLEVSKDCLCVIVKTDVCVNIWMMKEYGNIESWNILYTIPHIVDQHPYTKVLFVSEDDKLLMYHNASRELNFGVYDSRTNAFINMLQHYSPYVDPVVYLETLISPL